MESKQNDLMLNILENPSFSISDFQNVGLTAENTSLESEKTYASSPIIQNNPLFQNSNGDFDSTKFHKVYQGAQQAYNYLATTQPEPFKATFSKYNIFAPMDQRDWGQQFQIKDNVANPDQITKGLIRIGEDGPRDRSREEIAQTQLVHDIANDKWLSSPNDDFFGQLFGDTRILAQYDKDVDINGKERGQAGFDENNIEHFAGDYKLNENGTYYYETANGRNIYNKQVLHMSDIITTDGVGLNAIDFLDSDGIDKSPIGSLVKNTALIGSMFLPYVGPVVTGATILQQALTLGATLGKIAMRSPENPKMNYLIGLSESTNFMNTRSEYSKEHNWSIENLLGMVGDVVGQLKQQREMFKYLPAIVKGNWGTSEANQLKLKQKYLDELNAASKRKLSSVNGNPLEYASKLQKMEMQNSLEAADMLEKYMSSYYNVGGTLSKAYMTMLTVNDIYGEAIEAGASSDDASIITAGYAATEYMLLSTDIGQWILPELRAARQRARGVTKALTKETLENFSKLKAAATTPEAKRNFIDKLLDFGKKRAQFDYAIGKKGTETLKAGFGLSKSGAGTVFAGALAEATEETSEELLADFQRGIFNVIQQLRGTDVRMKPFDNWEDRYAMSFLGGFLGGGISAGTLDYKQAKNYANMTYNQAVQELISMTRNDQLKDIYKILDKETIGNRFLSAKKVITDDTGNVIGWEQGDSKDNQDLEIKNRVRTQLRLIRDTLDAAGGYVTDDELLSNNLNLLKDLRYGALRNTTSAGKFIQEFNRLDALYVQKVLELNQLNSPQVKAEEGEGDQAGEESAVLEQRRKQINDDLEEIKEQLENMRSGKLAPLFMAHALIESTPFISKALMSSTYRFFVEAKEKRKWEDLSESDKVKYIDEWNTYQKTDMKDDVDLATHGYLTVTNLFGGKLLELENAMKAIVADANLQEYLNSMDSFFQVISQNANLLRNNYQDETLTPDTWTEDVQENANNENIDPNVFVKQVVLLQNAFEEELNAVQKARQDAEELHDSGAIDDDTYRDTLDHYSYKPVIENYLKSVSDYINNTVYNPLMEKVQGFIKAGYVNGAVKEKLLNSLDKITQLYGQLYAQLDDELTMVASEYAIDEFPMLSMGASLSDVLGVGNPFEEKFRELTYSAEDGSVKSIKDQLKDLKYTPIMDILDNFVLNVTANAGGQMKISDLLKGLSSLYNQNITDVGQFNIENKDLLTSLREGLQLIELLEAVVEGARNDTIRLDSQISAAMAGQDRTNLWGINTTLNQVHKKAPKLENDTWVELPEISGELADMMLQDIRLIKNQLGFYADLYAINSGQKLHRETRVSTNINYLLYEKLKKFVIDVVPDDWDKSTLEDALSKTTTLEELISGDKPLSISNEIYTEIEKERIMLETAVYKFFNEDNNDKVKDVKKLSELFAADKFKLFTSKSNLLTEKSSQIDDHAFIAWLAMKAALNSNTYHRNFKELLVDSERAPLASQELGTYLHLANALNGDVISNFQKAVKRSMLNYFDTLSFDQRKELLKDELGDNISTILALESGKKLLPNLSFVPIYSNITFVEGIPGAGKSEAVNRFAVRYLQKYNPEVLGGAWVAHISEEDAIKYGKNINLADGSYKVFDRKSLMESISDDWYDFKKDGDGNYTVDNDQYLLDDVNQIVTTWKLKNQRAETLPKLIIIDEVSRYTQFDLLLLDKFAKKYGISIITTGDLDQSQARGKFTLNDDIVSEIKDEANSKGVSINTDIIFNFGIDRNTMMRVPKLGTSLRTANTQKTKNQPIAQNVVQTDKGPLQLTYYEDDTTLAGDKVYVTAPKSSSTGTGASTTITENEVLSDEKKANILKDVKERMIPRLKDGEKIGFIYYSDTSELYKLLMSDSSIANYIEKYQGNSAQGKEGKFWIVEVDPKKDLHAYLQDLYTGITRAQEASILITPMRKGDVEFSSVKEDNTQIESLNPDAVKKYCEKVRKIYESVTTDDSPPIEYTERTKEDTGEEPEEEEPTTSPTPSPAPAPPPAPPVEDNTEIENAVKGSEEFILPNGYTATKVGEDIVFSKPIPISKEWVEKYFSDTTTTNGVDLLSNDVWYALGGKIIANGKIEVAVALKADPSTNVGSIISNSDLVGEVFNNTVDLTGTPPTTSELENKKNTLRSEIASGVLIKPDDIEYDAQLSGGQTVVHFKRNGVNVDMPVDPRFLLRDLDIDSLTEDEVDKYLNFINEPNAIYSITYNDSRVIYELADGRIIEGTTTDDLPQVTSTTEPSTNVVTNGEAERVEEVPVNEDTSMTPEEVTKFVAHENKKTNYGHGKEPQPEDNSSRKKSGDANLVQLLYSNNTFEFGAVTHPKKDTYDKPKHAEDRIDSISGILRAQALHKKAGTQKGWIFRKGRNGRGFDIKKLSDMIDVLGRLRGKSLNTESKQELEKYFESALGFSNIYCRFAIKNSSTDDNFKRGSKFTRFFKSIKEKLLFNRGGSQRSEDIGTRNLVIIVGSMENVNGEVVGDILELPLLTLNNPITVLKANQNMSEVYKRMYNAYVRSIEKGESQPEALEAARKAGLDFGYLRKTGKARPTSGAKNISNLIALYLNTDRCIFYQDDPDWTIAKNLKSYGPQLNINRGQFDPDYNPDLVQTDKMISLDEFAKDKTLHVSSIMAYTRKDGKFEYGDDKVISGFISQPGHPFVLYTDDPDLDTDSKLIAEFIEQQKNKKGEKKDYKPRVKLAYVIGPAFEFEEYMTSLLKFTTGKDSGTLGNIKTPLDIVNALMFDSEGNENPELLDLFVKIWGNESGNQYYNDVKDLVLRLRELPLAEQVVELKKVQDSGLLGFNNKTVSSQLQNVLKQLVQNSGLNTITGGIDYIGHFKQKHMDILVDLFKRSGKKFYDTARLTSKTENNLFAFVKVDQSEGGKYHIDNNGRSKNNKFYIHGNLSSSMFAGDNAFNEWIDQIVNDTEVKKGKKTVKKRQRKQKYKSVKEGAGGYYFSSDNEKYTNGESWFDVSEEPEVKQKTRRSKKKSDPEDNEPEKYYTRKIQDYLDADSAIEEQIRRDYPPRKEDDDNPEIISKIQELINNEPSTVCIKINAGKSGNILLEGSSLQHLGKGTKIVKQEQKTDGTYELIIENDGKVYSGIFNPNTNELELTEQKTNPSETPIIQAPVRIVNDANYNDWKGLMQAITVGQNLPAIQTLKSTLEAKEYNKFNELLKDVSYIRALKRAFEKNGLVLDSETEQGKIYNSVVNPEQNFCPISFKIKMLEVGNLPF